MTEILRYAVASLRDGEHVVKTATRGQAQTELERLQGEQRADLLARKRGAPEPGAIVPHPGYEFVELPEPDPDPTDEAGS